MKITSSSFDPNCNMPEQYSYKDGNISPPLEFSEVPANAKSLALICHDPDAPMPGGFTHWVVWNIPPDSGGFGEGAVPHGAIQGLTDWGKNDWGGPMPPSGTHRYIFYLYALDSMLKLPANTNKTLLEKAIDGREIDKSELIGLFSA